MSDEKLLELIDQLENGDEREIVSKEILAMCAAEPALISTLYLAHFNKEGEAYNEIYRIFLVLGDEMFESDGTEGIEQEIIKAMSMGASKARQWIPEEIHSLSIGALMRWGLEIPPVKVQPILVCHICGAKITEQRVKRCFLLSCENAVCREHAKIMENPSGFGNWFCTQAHYNEANHNPTLMM